MTVSSNNMHDFIHLIQKKIPYPCFSDTELVNILKDSQPAARYGLVKRAIAKGDLIHVRRGLYCLAKHQQKKPNLFELAHLVYGPSYVSLESALSAHGWIPERVVGITSASLKRSAIFENPLAVFSYARVPKQTFYAGVEIKKENDATIFMALPWTALADYVYVRKKDWQGIKPVIGSLRVDEETIFSSGFHGVYEGLIQNYKSRRVKNFLKGIGRDLKK